MASKEDLPAVLTPAQVAAFTGLNVKTVYASIRAGDLPARKVGGRRYLVVRDVLLAWLSSQGCVPPRKERR